MHGWILRFEKSLGGGRVLNDIDAADAFDRFDDQLSLLTNDGTVRMMRQAESPRVAHGRLDEDVRRRMGAKVMEVAVDTVGADVDRLQPADAILDCPRSVRIGTSGV